MSVENHQFVRAHALALSDEDFLVFYVGTRAQQEAHVKSSGGNKGVILFDKWAPF